jgi:hypothetical protein
MQLAGQVTDPVDVGPMVRVAAARPFRIAARSRAKAAGLT